MKKLIFVLTILVLGVSSCNTAQMVLGQPTSAEVDYALHLLLDKSTLKTLRTISTLSTDGVEGLLPEEIQPVFSILKNTGVIPNVDKVDATIAKISQEVAEETTEIIRDAAKQLTFRDAVSIVVGGQDAATEVLKNAVYKTASQRYSEKLNREFTKIDPNFNTYWTAAAGTYNLLAKNKIDTNLPDLLAKSAVNLIFNSISDNEKEIRKNPMQIKDVIFDRVFSYYK